MNNRAVTLSIVMALIAVLFMESYVSSIEEQAERKFGTKVLAVVAKEDIGESKNLNETLLELKPIPKRFLEPSAISFEGSPKDPKVTNEIKSLATTVAIIPINKGEQITYNKITEPGIRTGLSPQVPPGKRGFRSWYPGTFPSCILNSSAKIQSKLQISTAVEYGSPSNTSGAR